MKKTIFLTVLTLLMAEVVHAAGITWGIPTMAAADSDVSTEGTLLYAERWTTAAFGSAAISLGGVDFEVASKADGGNVNIDNYGSIETNDGHADSGNYLLLSTAYRAVFAGDYYSANSGTIMTLNNLTAGHTYLLQMWSGDDRYGASNALRVSGDAPGATVDLLTQQGTWVIGTFTADATTQTLNYGNGGATVVNALQVRSIESSEKALGSIWFIGDSITQSNADGDSAGSPRKSLYDLLTTNDYTFTYTGHHALNVDGLPTTGTSVTDNLYHYHSGVSGIRIGEAGGASGFAYNLSTYWSTGRLPVVKPSKILIMLGTNDVATPDGAIGRLRKLVQDIYALPNVGKPTIFLASIPPNGRSESDIAYVAAFNAEIPGIVSDFQAEGKDIHFVDQFTPLNNDYANVMNSDNLHPNAAGNDVMAQTWFDEISAPVTAVISATPLSGALPLTVDFDASSSTGSSAVVSYSWSFGDGATGSGVTTSHTYTDAGTYQAVLIATTASNRVGVASVEVTASEWPGTPMDFNGYDQYTFTTNGLDCNVAVPETIAEGKPWIWRARFWGHQAGPDVALLEAGYHVVYVDVANLFGSPTAVARFDAFYDFLTVEHGFDTRAVLEGMSRGGLAIYNWAAQNPGKVHCVYADAPVCDFKSWPGGLYDGDGSESSWATCLAAYGFTEEEAIAYGGNPVDNMQPLAEAGIPLLHVVGDIDTVVPVSENTAIVEERYNAFGGWIEVLHKPDVGHVHGLDDPSPIVEFILNSMNEIHNVEASSVENTSATLNGLLSLKGTDYDIQVYWGLSDGGTNGAAWDHSASLGSWTIGDANLVSYDVSALAQSSTYYYSFSASNVNGRVWDDALSFSMGSDVYYEVSSSKSMSAPTISTNDLAQTQYFSSSATGTETASTRHAELFNGIIGNEDDDINDVGEVRMNSDTTVTITFDTSVNTQGYDLTGINTYFGWSTNGGLGRSNQGYEIILDFVDGGTATLAGPEHWEPNSPVQYWTSVSFTGGTNGVMAAGVKAVSFDISNNANAGGVLIAREFDLFGVPTEDSVVGVPLFLSGVSSVSNGNFNTQFTGTIGSHYQVEYSDDLGTNSWQVVTDIISLATSPMVISMPITNSVGFYRVIGLP